MAEWLGRSGVTLVTQQLTAAGKAVLTKAIKRAGWQVEEFALAHPDDIPAGTRAVVVLGDEALYELTGWKGGKRAVKYTRGYLLPSYTGLPVVPTFDPGKVAMGQMKLLGLVMQDLGVAMQAAVGTRKVCVNPKALVEYKVGLQALKDLYNEAASNPELLIAFDLETATSWEEDEDESIEFSRDIEDAEGSGDREDASGDGSECDDNVSSNHKGSFSRDALDISRAGIRTVQFSLHPGTGISCDWGDECRDWVQRIMSLPNTLIGQNIWMFDEPILRNHGIDIPEGTVDLMWMHHHIQPDLPAHLQGIASLHGFPFPWKHLSGSDLDFYGSADVDACQWIYRSLPKQLERLGLLDGYNRYVRQFRPILAAMERRGIPVNKLKLEDLRSWLTIEVDRMDSELQPQVPLEVRSDKKKEAYAGLPNPVKAWLKEHHPEINSLAKAKQGKAIKDLSYDDDLTKAAIYQLGFEIRGGKVFKDEKLPFNPRSSQQIISYLKAKGYPVPKKFKDGSDTTGDKELAKLEVKTKDPVLTLVRSVRAYSKMSNAYAGKIGEDGKVEGGWQPGPDGFVRATFTFGPATWQLAAKNPPVMTTPKRRKELAERFRKCIEAPAGYKLISFDFKSFHALTTALEARDPLLMRLSRLDVHSFLAAHLVNYPGVETCTDMNDADLLLYLEEVKAAHKNVREFQAKPCIAEGELVLTDKGLVPIENITLAHKLWDGVEWVQHDGVICKGIKETISYDGLRATPDHKVYTQSGGAICFGKAASLLERLEVTGTGRQAIRTRHSYFREIKENRWIHTFKVSMRNLWTKGLDLKEQFIGWKDSRLSAMQCDYFETFDRLGSSLRWNGGQMSASPKSGLCGLWSQRDRAAVRFSQGFHSLDREESTSRKLQWSRDRSNRQRWTLRTGEFETSYSQGADKQPAQHCQSFMEGGIYIDRKLSQSLWLRSYPQDSYQMGANWRGDNSSRTNGSRTESEELSQNRGEIERVRVYDIVNAGPRHRFTVSNVLVANCVHGTNFGQSARRMYFEYAEHFANQAAATRLLDLYKALFPKLFIFQEAVCEEADRNGKLITKWGAVRWFWDVKKWTMRDGRWVSSLGRDAEKVKAFKPSNDAHGMFRDKVLQAYEKGWTERYGLCNLIHDDTLWLCPDKLVEECVANVRPLLEAPVPQLADPVMCPDGFVCGVDCSIGQDWASMKGVK